MNRVYLIATPEDEEAGVALAEWLKRHGCVVRTEYGKFSYPPAHAGEVTLALWSRASAFSNRRMLMVNRAIDAWENELLVMVKLEHGIPPQGLRDLEMIDLTFEASREHRYLDVLAEIRDATSSAFEGTSRKRRASSGPGGGGGSSTEERSTGAVAGMVRPDEVQSSADGAVELQRPPAPAAAPRPEKVKEAVGSDHLFVSYSHGDKERVYPLVDAAQELGHEVWIDRDDLEPGERWAGLIVKAIKQSRGLWLMCSEKSFSSDHVRREVYLADKYKKPLLPVRLDNAEMPEDIEYFLVDRQWIELEGLSPEQRVSALRAALE